jgi:signal transduction histidine kinase
MHRVLELVNAILDVNRLESGRLTLDRQPVALGGLVQNVVEWLLSRLDDKQINLALDINETLPSVSADEEMLGRVLQNLLDNAIKFTPPHGAITVRAQPLPAESPADEAAEDEEQQDRVCVSVIDTGPGIPADIRDRVFDKFTTGGAEEGGSGLGLYFCKIVLEAHGESIWVDAPADEEAGTAFHFTLPLHTAVSPPA